VAFGLPGGRDFCGFSIEEEFVCGVQGCSGNFVLAPVVTRVQVLRAEDLCILLTPDIGLF
jgi:hypothetical protein